MSTLGAPRASPTAGTAQQGVRALRAPPPGPGLLLLLEIAVGLNSRHGDLWYTGGGRVLQSKDAEMLKSSGLRSSGGMSNFNSFQPHHLYM